MQAEKNKSIYIPIADSIVGITDRLKESKGQVGIHRSESVESHLRSVLGLLGYRPTERADKKATIAELAAQVDTCLKAEAGKLSEETQQRVQMYLHSTYSNLDADIRSPGAMPLKEVPTAPAKTPSAGPKEELSSKTVDELKKIAAEYQAEIAPDAKKADIVAAILKKAGYAQD